MSPHLTSSHLIPSLLTCHLSKFFSTVFMSSEHWKKVHLNSSQLLCMPESPYRQSLHKILPSTTSYYKACTKSTSQYYFVLQSLHKVVPSTTSYHKACTRYFPVLLRTTKQHKTKHTRTHTHTTYPHTTYPHTTYPHTTYPHTTYSHTTYSHTHNLPTHNLLTHTHHLPTHHLLTHHLPTHNLHTQLPHTQLTHTHNLHTHTHTTYPHTTYPHTTYSHTTFPHTHNLFTHRCTTKLAHSTSQYSEIEAPQPDFDATKKVLKHYRSRNAATPLRFTMSGCKRQNYYARSRSAKQPWRSHYNAICRHWVAKQTTTTRKMRYKLQLQNRISTPKGKNTILKHFLKIV